MGMKSAERSFLSNPLKMSQPLGGALAFLGLGGALPVFHGSQGCTSFGLVLLGRHFKESIPLQTTAMSEITSTLGGGENISAALLKIFEKGSPSIVGLLSTGLTETKGEDIVGEVRQFLKLRKETVKTPVVAVSTPDFKGGLEEGYQAAVCRIVEELVPGPAPKKPFQLNILAGSHLTVSDLDYLKEVTGRFGFEAVVLPDLSRSLDGFIPDRFAPMSMGGTTLEEIRSMGGARATLVIGKSLLPAGDLLFRKTGVPSVAISRLMGLEAFDRFLLTLSHLSGRAIPESFHRERGRLEDAMLDSHFFLGGKKAVLALEPDLLNDFAAFMKGMGVSIPLAVSPTEAPILSEVPADLVRVGDLGDLEEGAGSHRADFLATHSHGRQASQRLGIPLFRMGFPVFDRLGATHRLLIGYRGAKETLFRISNLFLAREESPDPETWYPGSSGEPVVFDDRDPVPIRPVVSDQIPPPENA